jgi:hypothetical protein
MLRGREAVRAIGDLGLPPGAVLVFIHNHVFGTDALFIRTKNMVGARSAQWPFVDAGGRMKPGRTAAL